MSEPYKKRVVYNFDAGNENWNARQDSRFFDTWFIEETRKSGQEDCHMSCVLERKTNGKWKMTEGRETIDEYSYSGTATQIIKYFNKHGAPGEKP